MTTSPGLRRPTAPPPAARLAAAAGATTAWLAVSGALLAAGHGIAGWLLMLVGGVVTATVQVSYRGPRPVPAGRTAVAAGVAFLGLTAGAVLAARATVDQPWLVAAVALASGAAAYALVRWTQARGTVR